MIKWSFKGRLTSITAKSLFFSLRYYSTFAMLLLISKIYIYVFLTHTCYFHNTFLDELKEELPNSKGHRSYLYRNLLHDQLPFYVAMRFTDPITKKLKPDNRGHRGAGAAGGDNIAVGFRGKCAATARPHYCPMKFTTGFTKEALEHSIKSMKSEGDAYSPVNPAHRSYSFVQKDGALGSRKASIQRNRSIESMQSMDSSIPGGK